MSHLYEDIEPNIIDDELLQKVLEEERTEDIDKIVGKEGFNLKDVKELQLSFRSEYQNIHWVFFFCSRVIGSSMNRIVAMKHS